MVVGAALNVEILVIEIVLGEVNENAVTDERRQHTIADSRRCISI